MNILHVTHQYTPETVGGVELVTQMIAHQQVTNGQRVGVFYPSVNSGSLQTGAEGGVTVYAAGVGPRSRNAVFVSTWRQQQLARYFEQVIETFRPNIIHIQHMMGLPVALLDIIQQHGLPYVVTLHDYWYLCANAQLLTNTDETVCDGPDAAFRNCADCALARAGIALPLLANGVQHIMRSRVAQIRPILAQANAVIALSHFTRSVYEQAEIKLNNVVHIPQGMQPPDQLPLRQPRSEGVHIVYVGSIAPQKGTHILADAINQLDDTVQITIAGALDTFPDYSRRVRATITHPNVTFLGRINREQVWALLISADLFVHPTLWYESSPLVIEEANLAKLPMLASNIGVFPEKIQHGHNGMLFETGNPFALAAAIKRIQADPSQLDRWRANLPPPFTVTMHVDQLHHVYEQAIGVAT